MPLSSPTVSHEKPSSLTYNYNASILPLCSGLARRITIFLNNDAETPLLRSVQEQIKVALNIIDSTLERYLPDEISLLYNGSHDDLVLLALLLCALAGLEGPLPRALQTVYIAPQDGVAEVDAFITESVAAYRLDLERYALPKKEALKWYLHDRSSVKAILAGTRRSDAQGQSLDYFDEAEEEGWPVFVRVHPILDWKRDEIWAFIRHFDIPYCSFYGKHMPPAAEGRADANGNNDHGYARQMY